MRVRCLLPCAALLFSAWSHGQAQHTGEQRYYAPLNSAAAFVEYSNSSSHIILGDDRQRKFAGLTFAYQRRISATHWMAWDYSAEIRPILVESDPTLRGVHISTNIDGPVTTQDLVFAHQVPIENSQLFQDVSATGTVGGRPVFFQVKYDRARRWTYAPGLTPACFSVHLLPAHRLQPFLASTAGFIVSPRDIPEFQTSAFNFTFSFGGGVEWFRDRQRSWTVEYRVQHMSNKDIGYNNPGVDSQFIRVGYRFGF
jgi:hypothetical protein